MWRVLPLIALLLITTWLTGCASIQPQPLTPFADGRHWMLEDPLRYRTRDSGEEIVVPAGFVTDFASVPKPGHSIYGPTGFYQFPAVIHDYLYWEQSTTRKRADDIFLMAMEDSRVDAFTREGFHKVLTRVGHRAWKTNAAERSEGLPRVVPEEFRPVPPNTTWAEYRRYLHLRGVRPDSAVSSENKDDP